MVQEDHSSYPVQHKHCSDPLHNRYIQEAEVHARKISGYDKENLIYIEMKGKMPDLYPLI